MNRADGIALLRHRAALARERLRAQWNTPPDPSRDVPFPWVVTGLGSSEAHARYLVALGNRVQPGAATFVPTAAFAVQALPAQTATAALIVFTQGLSANARIALAQRSGFRETVLFTATTRESLARADKGEATRLLEQLEREGAVCIPTAETDEYTILLRVIGPLCGYLSALQWWSAQRPGAIAPLSDEAWGSLFTALDRIPPAELRALADDFTRGVEYNFASAEAVYAQNLAFKRVEGLFLPEPVRRDLLQFAHGPFQQNIASATTQWIFASSDTEETTLSEHLWPMFARLAEPTRLLRAPLPAPYSILYYEMLLNEVLLTAIDACPHCQANWPGKGLDSEGYALDRPL